MHGEKESLSGQSLFKDYNRGIVEKVEYQGQTTCCLRRLQEKKLRKENAFSKKTSLQHIQLSDTTGT